MEEHEYVNLLVINIEKFIDSNTIIVEDFNTPLIGKERSSKQKSKEETMDLNDIVYRMNLNIFTTFHPKAAEYTFFLVHMKCSRE